MLLAKIKEKLFNRRNKIEIEDVEVKGDIPASIKALIESLAGLKYGYYIVDAVTTKIIYAGQDGELIPEDYKGICFEFLDDGFYIVNYADGEAKSYIYISPLNIDIYNYDTYETVSFNDDGVNKLNFAQLTHSFNELDPTLKQIVEDAVGDGFADGVACSEAQWSAIKSLLDKSLYLNYGGYSMIKITSDGLVNYVFGDISNNIGSRLEFYYDSNKLFIEYDII